MSNLRKSFLIVVDGQEHKIMTTARDMAAVTVDPTEVGGAAFTFHLLHEACLRLEVPDIPPRFDDFVDLLDDLEDLDGKPVGVPAEGLDPTRQATSDG
jgi:hypothetical protein